MITSSPWMVWQGKIYAAEIVNKKANSLIVKFLSNDFSHYREFTKNENDQWINKMWKSQLFSTYKKAQSSLEIGE